MREPRVAPVLAIGAHPSGSSCGGKVCAFHATFRCRLDQLEPRFTVCSSPQQYADLAEGSYRFRVFARDADGNHSPAVRWRWNVDLSPPDVQIDSAPASSPDDSAAFEFSSSEPGVHFRCRLDSEPGEHCSSPKAYAELAPGPHRFVVHAIDWAGNRSPRAAHRWTVGAG